MSGEKAALIAKNRDYYEKNRMSISRKLRLRKHGLTPEQFNQMLEDQDHKCAICPTPIKETYASSRSRANQATVDHCHETGKVRGLLCHHCNTGIGLMSDDPDRLESAARYLRSHRAL